MELGIWKPTENIIIMSHKSSHRDTISVNNNNNNYVKCRISVEVRYLFWSGEFLAKATLETYVQKFSQFYKNFPFYYHEVCHL